MTPPGRHPPLTLFFPPPILRRTRRLMGQSYHACRPFSSTQFFPIARGARHYRAARRDLRRNAAHKRQRARNAWDMCTKNVFPSAKVCDILPCGVVWGRRKNAAVGANHHAPTAAICVTPRRSAAQRIRRAGRIIDAAFRGIAPIRWFQTVYSTSTSLPSGYQPLLSSV